MICFNGVYRVSLTKISYFFPIAKSTIGPTGNFLGLNMKLYTVTKTMSAELTSETKFYMNFEPLTFGQ